MLLGAEHTSFVKQMLCGILDKKNTVKWLTKHLTNIYAYTLNNHILLYMLIVLLFIIHLYLKFLPWVWNGVHSPS